MDYTRLLITVAAALLAGRCAVGAVLADAQDVQLWTANSLTNVLQSARPPADAPTPLVLESARDEWEHGQIVVRGNRPISNLRAAIGDLRGPGGKAISASQCRCRFVAYILVEKNTNFTPPEELVAPAPCKVPDALLENEAVNVEAGNAQPIWVTVHVPKDGDPGDYTGVVRVTWDGGGRDVPVKLTVWPFAVPSERHLYYSNWFEPFDVWERYKLRPWSDEYWAMLDKYIANAAAHRQNVTRTLLDMIGCYREPDGKFAFDFSIFDRWVEVSDRHGMAEGIEIFCVGKIEKVNGQYRGGLADLGVIDRKTGKKETVSGDRITPKLLAAMQEHMRRRGWLDRALLHVMDEPSDVRAYQEASRLVHKYAPRMRRMDEFCSTGYGKDVEVWVPKLPLYYEWQADYDRARQTGAEMWLYTCCDPYGRFPNRCVDYPAIKTRIIHWLNWRYDAIGYLHWGLTAWTDDPYATATRYWYPPGESWIVYPGPSGPVDSMRYEALRDGIEDYEYMWLLTSLAAKVKKELGEAADAFDPRQLADELCRSAAPDAITYSRDPAQLYQARRRIAEEIIAMSCGPRLLVWTRPYSGIGQHVGANSVHVNVAAEPGTKIELQTFQQGADDNDTKGGPLELDKHGCAVRCYWLPHACRLDVTVKATCKGQSKSVKRTIRIVP